MDASNKTPLLVFAAIVAIYGILGWLDVANYAQGGWNTAPDNTVTEVLAGSPAEAGGLQVGDKLISLGGIPMSDARAQAERGRPDVGETWEFVVARDGAEVSLDVTFGELVPRRKAIAHGNFLIGFCLLLIPLYAYTQKQNASTHALALAGILFSFAFISGPYFESLTLRQVDGAVGVLLLWLGIAALVNFLLAHLRSGGNRLVYIPGLVAGLFIAWRILATPAATEALNNFGSILNGAVAAFYLIAALVIVYKSFSGASAAERESQGLQLMLIGTLIGILPVLIAIVVGVLSPTTVLPGQSLYFLTFIAIPITWSVAVLKAPAASAEASA